MRNLSSLLDMNHMDSLEFKKTSCIQNGRKQRFVVQNFIHSRNQYVTPQRIPWQPVASGNLSQVHLVSDIDTQILGHQSTTNIQSITVDINGTDNRSIFLGIVN